MKVQKAQNEQTDSQDKFELNFMFLFILPRKF